MKDKIYNITRSSQDGKSLSLTFKGLALMLIPIIISIASFSGIRIAEADLTQLVNEVSYMLAQLVVIVGLARKIYNTFKK